MQSLFSVTTGTWLSRQLAALVRRLSGEAQAAAVRNVLCSFLNEHERQGPMRDLRWGNEYELLQVTKSPEVAIVVAEAADKFVKEFGDDARCHLRQQGVVEYLGKALEQETSATVLEPYSATISDLINSEVAREPDRIRSPRVQVPASAVDSITSAHQEQLRSIGRQLWGEEELTVIFERFEAHQLRPFFCELVDPMRKRMADVWCGSNGDWIFGFLFPLDSAELVPNVQIRESSFVGSSLKAHALLWWLQPKTRMG